MSDLHPRLWTLGLLSTALLIGGGLEFGSLASASNQRSVGRAPSKPLRQAAPEIRLDLDAYSVEPISLPEGNPLETTVIVPTAAGPLTLDLVRRSLRTADFQVYEDRGDGELHPIDAPPVSTYQGEVAGVPESTVFASIQNGRFWAMVQRPELPDLVIEPVDPLAVANGRPLEHLVFNADAVVPDGRGCGNDLFDMDVHGTGGLDGMGGDEGGVAGTDPVYLVEIGIDSDYEFFQKNGLSVANTVNDIENIMNGVNTVYRRDVGILYEISTLIVRSSTSDPYSSNNIETALCEFGSTWNSAPENAIFRDVAQLFSGKSMAGNVIGLAWLGVVCNQTGSGCGTFGNLAYSVVESRYTTSYNLRVSLSAHEMGHNWNAGHCSGSTCHIMCASNNGCGGVTGGNLKFGTSSISTITSYRNQLSCDTLLPPPLELPFLDEFVSTSVSSSNWIYRKNAATSTLSSNPPSAPRTLLLDCAGNGLYQDDEVRSNFIPLDGYVQDVVEVSYWTQHRGPEAGERLVMEYLTFGNDWVVLNEVVSDGTVQESFVEHRHILPQNSKHDEFRIRFRAEVDETNDDWFIDDISVAVVPPNPAPENDACTSAIGVSVGATPFTTVGATDSGPLMPAGCGEGGPWELLSDVWFSHQAPCSGLLEIETCGSLFDTYLAVYTGQTCPGDLDAPLTCSQNFPLCGTGSKVFLEVSAGEEFLIRIGSAIADTTGDGTLTITCTGDGPACPTDLDGNGFTDGADLAGLLGSWGSCTGCAADIDGNGLVDGADLAALLGGWGACP
ncbi:MAG: M12 family metallo-peptidase [Phycisphaerales bacterium]